MSEHTPKDNEPDAFTRARSDEEPGAHSGAESQAQDRVVPGTASATEGYRTEGGTAHGEALTGVEAAPEDREPGREAGASPGEKPDRGQDDDDG